MTGGQGSHNKPTGCGASGAYALGPDDEGVIIHFIIHIGGLFKRSDCLYLWASPTCK